MISNNFLVFLFSSLHISFYFTILWIFLSLSKLFFSLFLSSSHQSLYLFTFISPILDFSFFLIFLAFSSLPTTSHSTYFLLYLLPLISDSTLIPWLDLFFLPLIPLSISFYLPCLWFLFLPYFTGLFSSSSYQYLPPPL